MCFEKCSDYASSDHCFVSCPKLLRWLHDSDTSHYLIWKKYGQRLDYLMPTTTFQSIDLDVIRKLGLHDHTCMLFKFSPGISFSSWIINRSTSSSSLQRLCWRYRSIWQDLVCRDWYYLQLIFIYIHSHSNNHLLYWIGLLVIASAMLFVCLCCCVRFRRCCCVITHTAAPSFIRPHSMQ